MPRRHPPSDDTTRPPAPRRADTDELYQGIADALAEEIREAAPAKAGATPVVPRLSSWDIPSATLAEIQRRLPPMLPWESDRIHQVGITSGVVTITFPREPRDLVTNLPWQGRCAIVRDGVVAGYAIAPPLGLPVERADGKAPGREHGYAPKALAKLLEVSAGKLNAIAKEAGVTTPARGQKDFQYSASDARRIAQHLVNTTRVHEHRMAANELLRTLGQLAEDRKETTI